MGLCARHLRGAGKADKTPSPYALRCSTRRREEGALVRGLRVTAEYRVLLKIIFKNMIFFIVTLESGNLS